LSVERLLSLSHAFVARLAVAPYQLRAIAIVTDRFDRTAFHRFFAKSFFLWRLRLFIDIGMATVIIPLEVCGRGFAAQITVNALIIDVEFARNVLGVFVCGISHGFPVKMKWNVRKKRSVCNQSGR
jgi:hypothetical protein